MDGEVRLFRMPQRWSLNEFCQVAVPVPKVDRLSITKINQTFSLVQQWLEPTFVKKVYNRV